MTLTFNVGGRLLSADQLIASAPPAKKAPPRESLKAVETRDEAKQSLGFVVSGYPPLEIAQAKVDHEERMEQERELGKSPKPFELATYARKHKPTKARRRPFEIESAADDCAVLLKKQGWHLVTVTELLLG